MSVKVGKVCRTNVEGVTRHTTASGKTKAASNSSACSLGTPWSCGPSSLPSHRYGATKKHWGCTKTEVHQLAALLLLSRPALFPAGLNPSLLKSAVWYTSVPSAFTHFHRRQPFIPERTYALVISYDLCNIPRGKSPSVEVKLLLSTCHRQRGFWRPQTPKAHQH